jgi:hypothetical protein
VIYLLLDLAGELTGGREDEEGGRGTDGGLEAAD